MNIKIVVVGYLQTNCYILEKSGKVLIIDPGDEADTIIKEIDKRCKVIGILITHSHKDHVGAIYDLVKYYNCDVYSKDNLIEGNHVIDEFSFEVIYTPGHLYDSVVYYFVEEKIMFVGDFIFKGSIGRVDLPGANRKDMRNSLSKIIAYPDDLTLYPGHSDFTTLGNEKEMIKYFMNTI